MSSILSHMFSSLAAIYKRVRPRSLRVRLMLWNISALTLILAIMGGLIQYTVRTNLQNSVDRELADRAKPPIQHGPSPFGPPHGPPPEHNNDHWQGETLGFMFSFPFLFSIHSDPPHSSQPGHDDMHPNGVADRFAHFPDASSRSAKIASNLDTTVSTRPHVLDLQGHGHSPFGDENVWDQDAFRLSVQGKQVYTTIFLNDEPIRIISQPIKNQRKIVGVVQAAYPLAEVNLAIKGMQRTMLALIPIALLLSGTGGALLTRRALRPVQQITRTAQQIGSQDLAHRLPVVGQDEFSQLAMTMNGMLSRIEKGFNDQKSLVRQLEQAVEQQRRFTGDASHELRTPLTVIKANVSLTLRDKTLAPDYRQTMEEINVAADAMNKMVHDLLLLARSDGGQLGRKRVALSVQSILERSLIGLRGVQTPVIHLPSFDSVAFKSLWVCGNEDEVTRLFANLMENAVRYTPQTGSITLTACNEGDQVRICVADTGIGIAPEHLPHLGERFYRVDPSRSRPDGGAGLGISICKSIVEAHEGTLEIESSLGKGTTVCVALPGGVAS